jgi:phospholipid transport system substrate-binding protein
MAAGAPPAASPTESVRSTIAEVTGILRDDALKQPEQVATRRDRIETVLRRRVDYEEMAKRSLGLHWLDLTGQERREFVDLFVQLLRDSFAGKIEAYTDEQVLYLSEQRAGDLAEVRTKLAGAKTDTRLDFRLAERGAAGWVVYDVVIDGASIVRNYRAQFASIIRHTSYEGLVRKMKAKAVVVKTFETVVP